MKSEPEKLSVESQHPCNSMWSELYCVDGILKHIKVERHHISILNDVFKSEGEHLKLFRRLQKLGEGLPIEERGRFPV